VSTSRPLIEDRAIATVTGEEYESGYVAIGDGRISAIGSGRAPVGPPMVACRRAVVEISTERAEEATL
jgi:imidazolonepropionase-like amidohydrolase